MKKIIGGRAWFCALLLPSLLIAPALAAAELVSDKITRSRLLATGGASTIEGSAGGGIVPMAVLAGYGAQEEQGAVAFASYVDTGDYQLEVVGGSWSWRNRVELSIAQQKLTHESLTAALSLPTDSISQRIISAKLRVAGDLIYTPMPQISIGIQHKKNLDFLVPAAVGAKDDSGTDINLTATKLILGAVFDRNLLLNANLRYTNANQTGLVGFGGDKNDQRDVVAEISTGLLLNRHWLVGAEYRQKPNNLSFIKEDDWQTVFVGWFPNKRIALVAAYVDLGEVATFKDQTGWYLSLQGSF
ncbi:hypothetical protein CBP51_12045 [Cellvibrio mixtus]|uniref:DUF3034 domain-containing protein n=1 Tax=Cellvibrio mixtus TaxID=39650 RepID=A0A266QCY5_9GAMM|nr:DUF3034 family protein [Cellvibrio mixtus]OZY87660.1 hypothetical protein CBP51_12045 [Cellvibrio mixtus]